MFATLVQRATFAASVLVISARLVHAQAPATGVAGTITDEVGAPVSGAIVRIVGSSAGVITPLNGTYRITGLEPGSATLVVRRLGFAPDTARVMVRAGEMASQAFRLRRTAASLGTVAITVSPRLSETQAQVLARQQAADNIVSIMSGDEIRALPNGNAAEAAARIAGVSTERDEGEGKFVQVRGTAPNLTSVSIDGVRLPGTESNGRIPKLDVIPSDLLGAIEVHKTLSADMDADAIGGSVNLVSKVPEGAPRGYVSGQFGQTTILDRQQGQGSLMYGGRFGEQRKLGVLFGATADVNQRSINDLELGWGVDGAGRSYPVEWDQRDYIYNRSRYGAGLNVDYRFDDGSSVFVRGLYSAFNNFGKRYRYDIGAGGDSAGTATGGIATGATFVRESQDRTPRENLYGFTLGGKTMLGGVEVTATANLSGSSQSETDYRTNDFGYDGPGGNGLTLRYGINKEAPTYAFINAGDQALASSAANYALTKYTQLQHEASGTIAGGGLDALWRYRLGEAASTLAFGAKVRSESRSYVQTNTSFKATGSLLLSSVVSPFSDPTFYQTLAKGFDLGTVPDYGAVVAYENGNPGSFQNKTNANTNALAGYSGSERIASGYVMNTSDFGALRVNLGARLEQTAVSATGTAATKDSLGATALSSVTVSPSYTDVFPSLQLRYAVDEGTNVRFAVTRGIARPFYTDLAPHLTGQICVSCQFQFGNLSVGNPDLKPQHAWNYDLLGETYFSTGGVLSGGVFYKQITDFIYNRSFVYQGPVSAFNGYYGNRPANGGDASLWGFELAYSQRFSALPGALAGLGVDLNWTHVESKATLLADTASTSANLGNPQTRSTTLPRTSPNIANVALTYELGPVSARVAFQHQGASLVAYGDGTPTANGDDYFYDHNQVDASIIVSVTRDMSVQLQALNLNDAVFGFYNGSPSAAYSVQREVYGRSFILGIKYGFGAATGGR